MGALLENSNGPAGMLDHGPINAKGCPKRMCGHLLGPYEGTLALENEIIKILVNMKVSSKKTGKMFPQACFRIDPEGQNDITYSLEGGTLALLSNHKKKNEFVIQLGENHFFHIVFNAYQERDENIRGLYYTRTEAGQLDLLGELSLKFSKNISPNCS